MTGHRILMYSSYSTTADASRCCEGGSNSSHFSFPNSSSVAKRTDHKSFTSRPQNHSSRKFQGVIRTQGEFRHSHKSYIWSTCYTSVMIYCHVWKQPIRWGSALCFQDNLYSFRRPVTAGSQAVLTGSCKPVEFRVELMWLGHNSRALRLTAIVPW